MAITVGSRIGPYEIVALLGAGGMGEVWRARDRRLDRDVAIKVVRGSELDDDRRRRFEHEARAIGQLQHPNLLVVFDVGEHEGSPYLVTELLEGETLRARLAAGLPPVARALAWTRAIVAGLAAAHAKGIVHRDLKPENVFLCADGGLKLLDFGLAKRIGEAHAPPSADGRTWTQLTEPGLVVGTCGYMAPEQVRGQRVDQRADLFALGTILHELLSGRAPFARAAPLESLAAVLAEAAPPLPATTPPALAGVVTRCLEKEPARRFADARELLSALDAAAGSTLDASTAPPRAPGGAAGGTRALRSVAVLPFRELSEASDTGELGLGIADAIVTELASARTLLVRPTAAILRFRDRAVEPLAAARELDVDALLDGRFQRAGTRLRVTVQLVDSASGASLWATKIDGSLDDPFRLQDEIARHVADALAGELLHGGAAAAPRAAPAAGVGELYLRGRALLARETWHEVNLAVEALEAAVALDPRFALGWATLADAYSMIDLEFDPSEAWHAKSWAATQRALELEPELPEGRYLRGRLAWSSKGGWDHALGLTECAAAVTARPSLHEAWHRLGTILAHVSLLEEASPCFARAHQINPHDLSSYVIWGYCRLLQSRFEEALEMTERVWSETPSAWAAYQRTQARLHLGRVAEAERVAEAAGRQFPDSPLVLSVQALLAALRGDATETHRQIARVEQHRRALNHFHHAEYELACALAQLGERDAALEQLANAARHGFPCVEFFRRDPFLAPLRSTPGYAELVRHLEVERARYAELWRTLALEV